MFRLISAYIIAALWVAMIFPAVFIMGVIDHLRGIEYEDG